MKAKKVVDNYFDGTRVEISKANLFLYDLKKGLEKEVAEFRAGQEPAETRAKIVPLDYFTDAAWRVPSSAPITNLFELQIQKSIRNG